VRDGAQEIDPVVHADLHRQRLQASALAAVDTGLEDAVAAVGAEHQQTHVALGAAIEDGGQGMDQDFDSLEALQAAGEEDHLFIGADAEPAPQIGAIGRGEYPRVDSRSDH